MGAFGPIDQRFMQPINQIFFLFGSFFFLSVFLEEHAEKLFSIRVFNNYLDNYLKTFVQPINQNIFQIFFLFGSFFFLSVFLKNMQRNCFPFG